MPHLWHYDALIKLDDFQVVVEHFKVEPTLKDTDTVTFSGDEHSMLRIYLQFSFEEAQILAQRDKTVAVPLPAAVNSAGRAEREVGAKEMNRDYGKTVALTVNSEARKERRVGEQETDHGKTVSAALAVNSNAMEDKEVEPKKKEVGHGKSAAQLTGKDGRNDPQQVLLRVLFLMRHNEDPTLRRCSERLSYTSGVDIKIVGWHSSCDVQSSELTGSEVTEQGGSDTQPYGPIATTVKPQGKSVQVNCKHPSVNFSDFKVQAKSSVLKTTSSSSFHWLRFLHPGCLYVLSEQSPDERSSRIFKVIMAHGRQAIEVTSEMNLERVCACVKCLTSSLDYLSSPEETAFPPQASASVRKRWDAGSKPDASQDLPKKQICQTVDAIRRRFSEEDAFMAVEGVLNTLEER